MLNVHQRFCQKTFYDGRLVDFKVVHPDNFNCIRLDFLSGQEASGR